MVKMFSAQISDDTVDVHEISGDLESGDVPDLSDIMKIGVQIGVVDKTPLDDDTTQIPGTQGDIEDPDVSVSLENCPNCKNYISRGTPVCPFCDEEIG